MANLLALETSTDICSVSLSRGEEIFNFHQLMPKQHTENLFGIISGLFEESGLSFEKLDGVAVAVGPGSYTGVRLACSVAQGIAFSHDIKAVTLSSLELLSLEAHRNLGLERINCISAANQGKVYVAESSFVDGDILTKMKLIDQESILRESFPENSHFIGEDVNYFNLKTNCEMANQEHLYYWKLLRLGLVKVIVLKQNLYFLYILMTKIAGKK